MCLQGRVKFPIGGTVRERARVDPVKLRDQQYSLDERRCVSIDGAAAFCSGQMMHRILFDT